MRVLSPLAPRVAPAPRTRPRPLRCALHAATPALRHVAPRLRRAARVLPPRALSAAGRTAAVTGAYISVAGAALLAAPLRTLGLLFACDGITPAWVRVFGVLCLTFGSYYGGAAALEARGAPPPTAFYSSTIFGRLALAFAFAALVATGSFPQRGLLLVSAPRLVLPARL